MEAVGVGRRAVAVLIDAIPLCIVAYLTAAIAVWCTKNRQRLGDIAAHTLVVKARVFIPVLMALAFASSYATESIAASPRYSDVVLSDSKGGAAKSTYKPDTAKIFLHAKLLDVPSGSKVKSDWIAVKTKVARRTTRSTASS